MLKKQKKHLLTQNQELLNKYPTNCFTRTWDTKEHLSIEISKEDWDSFSKEDCENSDKIMYLIEEKNKNERYFNNSSSSIYLFEDFWVTVYW